MKIDILTLFPNVVTPYLNDSIIKRAINKKIVEINVVNIRDFSRLNNNQVDDTPYGGGPGMVMMCEPIVLALESIKTEDSIVILTSASGKIFNQSIAKQLKINKHLIIICGHYEGIDERIKNFVDIEISIGEFVLTGGELPALVITDSVVRLLEGVINSDSLLNESYNNELYDYPVYTKPREFRNLKVPEVLLNGNHKEIEKYRKVAREKLSKKD